MRKIYTSRNALFISLSLLLFAIVSCKKENNSTNTTNSTNTSQVLPIASPVNLALYEADSSIYRELDIPISKIGNQSVEYTPVFDTGSGGMVIDADGILPALMITKSGFNFAGDSTVVNGITITNQTATFEYGADDSTLTTVYGNLAYAPVTIGDQNGNVVVKRMPFCLYYIATDANGSKLEPHFFDTFGVNSEYIYFSGNGYITSPFSYFDPGNGLTKGFKMAELLATNFSYDGTYVPGAVTVGLTASDLSSSSGFMMSQLNYYPDGGYVPIFPVSITYGNHKVSTDALFDTGTSGYSYIEDAAVTDTISQLPPNTQVSIITNFGFNYTYETTASDNSTFAENPNVTGAEFTIIDIDFFLNNEYLLDYAHNKLGLKNN